MYFPKLINIKRASTLKSASLSKYAFKPFKLERKAQKGLFIMSAFKNVIFEEEGTAIPASRSVNKANTQKLTNELLRLGVSASNIEIVKGIYGAKPETSVMVYGFFSFADAIALGEKYKQDSIIWGNPSLGFPFVMYFTNGSNKALVAVPSETGALITPYIDVNKKQQQDFYTRGRGGVGMSFQFDWHQSLTYGSRPLTFKDVAVILDKSTEL